MAPVDRGADIALHGCQPEMAELVVLQHELRVDGAEHALGVEKDDRTAAFVGGTRPPTHVRAFRRSMIFQIMRPPYPIGADVSHADISTKAAARPATYLVFCRHSRRAPGLKADRPESRA